jgi:nicotinamidase-related amidase
MAGEGESLFPGRAALILVDVQGDFESDDGVDGIPVMPGGPEALVQIKALVAAARESDVPVVFIQEVHKPTLVDFGRELDGAEDVHCLEDDPTTALAEGATPRPDEFLIQKRRYSAFFATELLLVLRSLKVDTVILVGGLTDVCVHYTAVDAHQHDFHIRVVTDCVLGSSQAAHDASLAAMAYLQSDALVDHKAVLEAFAVPV